MLAILTLVIFCNSSEEFVKQILRSETEGFGLSTADISAMLSGLWHHALLRVFPDPSLGMQPAV